MRGRSSLTIAALAGVALLAFALRPETATALAQTATVQPQTATVTVDVASKTGSTARLEVNVTDASNLAGFQFVLSYNSELLTAPDVVKTEFLTKSGRQIVCQDPVIQTGAIRYTCVTLDLQPPGVDGHGTLATVTFKTSGKGTSPLALSNVKLVHPDGSVLPSTSVNGTLTISGSDSLSFWLRIVIGTAAGGVALGLIALIVWWRRRQTSVSSGPESLGNDLT